MKNWTGVLIFIAIAIANILFEQQAQRKKRASSEETPDPAPPVRRRKPASSTESDEDYSSPPREPTLQETLQSLFENRDLEPRLETPPPVPKKVETAPAPAPILAKKHTLKAPVVPAPPAPPTPKSLEGAARKPASAWLAKTDFRSRKSLRRAVVMAEVLGRPKGL